MSPDVNAEVEGLREALRRQERDLAEQRAGLQARDAEIARLQSQLESTQFVLTEKFDKLRTLIEVSRQLNSTIRLQELLQSLMTLATRVMKARDSSLLLLDEDTNELVFNVALGEKGERVQQFRVRVGQGIAGEVAASGEPIMVDDVTQDSRWDKSFDERTGFVTKSIMAVPIKVRGALIGVIEVLNAGGAQSPLTGEDLEVLEAFAAQAGIALENARILDVMHTSIRQVSDVAGVGALMTDWAGELRVVNDKAREMLGLAGSDPVTMRTLRQLKTRPNIGRFVTDVLESGHTDTTVVEVSDGAAIQVQCIPIVDPWGKKLGVVTVLNPAEAARTA